MVRRKSVTLMIVGICLYIYLKLSSDAWYVQIFSVIIHVFVKFQFTASSLLNILQI